jgi:myo-inositol-1(or 4)-monophosphatase
MRNSPNLSIILKALDKITGRLARDFGEIENLQSNHFSATKFANSCYKRIKETLADELIRNQPSFNIEFTDGDKLTNDSRAEFNYIICPIDGITNLSRAIPAFATFIGLEQQFDGKKEVIAAAISNVANNELYWCEKGSGSFLNNRRLRVSSRGNADNVVCSVSNKKLLADLDQPKFTFRLNNCPSLDIGYLASGRLDLCLFEKSDEQFLKPLLLLLKEAGGIITAKENLIIAGNGKINLN